MCVLDLYTDTHTLTHTHTRTSTGTFHICMYLITQQALMLLSLTARPGVELPTTFYFLLRTTRFLFSTFYSQLTACCLLPSRMHIQCTRRVSSLPGQTEATAVKCKDACHTHTGTLSLSHTHTRKIIKLFILMQTFLLLQATVNYTPSALCAQQQQNKIKTWLTTQRNANFLLKRN